MDNEKQYKNIKPEIGRGCSFCETDTEIEAVPCGGCMKLHETNWLDEYPDNMPTDIFEVRFKNTRRSFYQNVNNLPLKEGDIVAVEASPGHDIGIISLTGDMVARQMRRTGFNPYNGEFKKIYRKAKPYDIERWQEAIALEHETMILSRQIAADMGLNMKIGDVEYQGDKIKAIFYYIADERVDFRELIKVFAEQFHIRIEMKQIGARQEAGRIGGIGACGRELCCTSWMSSFSSVTTGAARVQDISLNPQKLAGQCSKLKCCMMYEYDTYVDARKEFPRLREPLQTLEGDWYLVKNDILAGTMSFSSSKDAMVNVTTLPISRVKEIMAMNRAGRKADQLEYAGDKRSQVEEPTYRSGSDEDSITRFDKTKRNKKRGNRKERSNAPEQEAAAATPTTQSEAPATDTPTEEKPTQRRQRRERDNNRNERNERNDRRRDSNRGNSPKGGNNAPAEKSEKVEKPEKEERTEKPQNVQEGGNRPAEAAPATDAPQSGEERRNDRNPRNRRNNDRQRNNKFRQERRSQREGGEGNAPAEGAAERENRRRDNTPREQNARNNAPKGNRQAGDNAPKGEQNRKGRDNTPRPERENAPAPAQKNDNNQ